MELESITESPFLNAYKRFVLKEAKKEAIAADMEAKAAPMVNKINQPEAEDEDDDMEWDEGAIETDDISKISKYDYQRLHDFISLSYRTKRALLIYGDPGIGKSQMVQQFTRQMATSRGKTYLDWDEATNDQQLDAIKNPSKYFLYIDVRTDSLDPTDLAGIPKLQSNEEFLETQIPKWLYIMAQPESDGILFLDELNNAEPQMIKALYKVVDKKVGNVKLSKNFAILGAGNLGAEFGGNPLPWALTNRFESGVLIADAESWLSYAEKAGVDKRIIAFVKSEPEANFNPKPPGGFVGGDTHITWASPRAMMMLSDKITQFKKVYADAKAEGHPIQTPMIAAIKQSAVGLCGEDWAQKFNAFMKHYKSFDFGGIVKSAESGELQAEKRDKLHALLMFVMGKLKPALKRSEEQKTISEDDKGVFIGLAKITNDFKPEWKVNLFSLLKKDLTVEQLQILMTFLLRGDYDAKTKKVFIEEALPKIKSITSYK
jgi:hypothetical protein